MDKNKQNFIYEWQYSDVKKRGKIWYIIIFSFAAWLIIWWVLTKQYWLSFLLILATWIYFFINNNSPEIIKVSISESWFFVENDFYDFNKLNSYSIVFDWEEAVLLRLRLNSKRFNKLELRVDNDIARDLKNILPNFLLENDDNELSASEKLINILKL